MAAPVVESGEPCWTRLERQADRELQKPLGFPGAKRLVQAALACMPADAPAVERAHLLQRLGTMSADHADALAYFQYALALERQALGPDDPSLSESLRLVASEEAALDRDKQARDHLEQAVRIREAALGPRDPQTAESLFLLGMDHFRTSDKQAGEKLCRQALEILESLPLQCDSPLPGFLLTFGDELCKMGRCEEGRALQNRAVEVEHERDALRTRPGCPAEHSATHP